MKLVLISAVPVFLLLGSIAPVYAQPDQSQKEDKPEKQKDRRPQQQDQQRQQAQHAQQPQQRQQSQQRVQQQQDKQRQQGQQRVQQQNQQRQQGQRTQQVQQQQPQRSEQQARVWQQQGGWQEHDTWQQGRASHWRNEHRSWAQRGGYGGYYIPQDRFSLYFGSQHWFRINSRPNIVMGYPRFQYGGSSFLLVDPWPEYWPDDWYSLDDLYVDYDNGYYLYNRRDPGVALAITVVL